VALFVTLHITFHFRKIFSKFLACFLTAFSEISKFETRIAEFFEYDHQNRLKKHWHYVGNNPGELLVENTYNELSQLSNKK